MTTYIQRAKIEQDSKADPSAPPSGSTEAEVNAAIAFLARVRSAVLDVAEESMSVDPVPASGPVREAVAWARAAATNPDPAATLVLRLLLAKFDDASPADFVATTDSQIRAAVVAMVPALAAGRDVRR